MDSLPSRPHESDEPSGEAPVDPAVEKRQKRVKLISSLVTGLVILALGGLAVNHVMTKVDFAEVRRHLSELPLSALLQALGFTAAGYGMLTLYDVSALRFLRIKVRYLLVAMASFVGYAISNNVGWAVISGASVRYRVYSVAGLTATDVAKVVVFSTTTFTLGVCFMGSLGILAGPHPVAALLHLPEAAVQAMAGITLASLAAVCLVTGVTRRPVRLWRWSFSLPSTRTVVSQIIIASIEILFAGAALWVLLPSDHGATFVEFMGVFCAALVVAMISHVPGGIGVFETIVLLGLSAQGSPGGVLGALLLYRFIYYVLPLAVAGLTLISFELGRHRLTARGALARLRARRGP